MSYQALYSVMTKIRARYGKILTPADFRAMASSADVAEVASYLRTKTKFSAALSKINDSAIHRAYLEQLLKRAQLSDMESICRFERSIGDHLFSYIISREETDLLVRAVRAVSAGHKITADPSNVLKKYARFNLDTLYEIDSFSKLKDFLKNTDYKNTAAVLPQDGDSADIPLIAASLDRTFYSKILNSISRYGESDEKQLREIVLTQAELSDVSLIYRGKKCYAASENTLRTETLGFRFLISAKTFDRMLAQENGDEVLTLLRSTRYSKYEKDSQIPDPDRLRERILLNKSAANIHFSSSPPVVMMSYFLLLDIELSNIIKLIEGVRYGLPPDEIIGNLTLEEKEV